MNRIILAASCIAAAVSVGGATGHRASAAQATTATRQPEKIALIVLENEAASQIDGNTANARFVNDSIKPEGIRFSAMKECVVAVTDCKGSAENYTFQTSADNCGGLSTDTPWNDGGNPLAPTDCGVDIFADMTTNGQTWKNYEENYVGLTCTTPSGYTDSGGSRDGFARKHAPSLFYSDVISPPYTACPNTVAFPQNDSSATPTAITTNFSGSDSLPKLSYIVPDMCHDMHNGQGTPSTGGCQPNGAAGAGDLWNGHGASSSPCGGALITNKISASDCWLQLNWENIRKDVGQTGVVLLTWDEGNTATGRETIVAYAVPGTDRSGNPGTLDSCGSPPCTDSGTSYDEASVFRALSEAFNGTACPSNLDSTASSNCAAVSTLPIRVDVGTTGVDGGDAG